MDKEILSKKELSEKLSNQAELLVKETTKAKEYLNDYIEVLSILKQIDKINNDIVRITKVLSDYEVNKGELLEQKESYANEVSKFNEILNEAKICYEEKKSEVEELEKSVSSLEAIIKGNSDFCNNTALIEGYDKEVEKLNKLKEVVQDKLNEWKKLQCDSSKITLKTSELATNFEKINKSIISAKQKLTDLKDNLNKVYVNLDNKKKSIVNVDVIYNIIAIAKQIGYYNALADKDVSIKELDEKERKKDIDILLDDNQEEFSKLSESILRDAVRNVFLGYKGSDFEDKREVVICSLDNVKEQNKNNFNIIDIYFDDYVDNPTLLLCKEYYNYITVNKDNDAYTDIKLFKYNSKRHNPVQYRVFSYILNGLKAIHKISNIDLVNTMNRLNNSNKSVQYVSSIPSSGQYMFCRKGEGYVPLAISDTRLLAIPVECYTYEFLNKVVKEYNHIVKCICKKGGKIGYDK